MGSVVSAIVVTRLFNKGKKNIYFNFSYVLSVRYHTAYAGFVVHLDQLRRDQFMPHLMLNGPMRLLILGTNYA